MNPSSILNQLRAESLLEDSHILTQIDTLRKGLRYKTDGEEVSFDDFFLTLQEEISSLPRIELDSTISPGTESQYQIQLVTALERVFDEADRVLNRLLFFQSKLRAAQQQFQVLEVTFIAWYSIAATEFLNAPDFKTIKLNATAIKALAQSEFGRLMEGVNIDVETMVEVTKVLSKQILSHKTVAQEKYNLGKDQVNASWTSLNLPPEAVAGGEEGEDLVDTTVETESEEVVPAFVSKLPVIAPRLGPGDETIRQITEENERAVDELVGEIEALGTVGIDEIPTINGTPIDELTLPVQPTSYPAKEIVAGFEHGTWPGVEVETPATSVVVTAVNAEGETIPFATEQGVVDKLVVEINDESLTILPPTEDSLLPPGVALKATRLEPEQRPNGTIVIRTKEGFPDKIKCKNCNRRIRVNQTMIAMDGGWMHTERDDCAEKEEPRQVAAVAASTEVKGTFKKYGDPIAITPIVGEYSRDEVKKSEQDDTSNTFRPMLTTQVTVPIDREKIQEQIALQQPVVEEETASTILGVLEQQAAIPKPERKKITILPEDAEV